MGGRGVERDGLGDELKGVLLFCDVYCIVGGEGALWMLMYN